MAEDIIQGFRRLSTDGERLHALHKLVQTLPPRQRQGFMDDMAQRNDPMFILPFELVVRIFSHLEIAAAWSLQHVCKRWRRTLSSEEFARAVVSRWESHDPSDSGSPANAVTASLDTRIRHIQAMVSGRPFSESTFLEREFPDESYYWWSEFRKFDLKGCHMARLTHKNGDGGAIIVRNLASGEITTLRGEARENIQSLILTTALAAFITYGASLYVFRFGRLRESRIRVQMPSLCFRATGGDGETIAMVSGGMGHSTAYMSGVLLYDGRSNRLLEFPFGDAYRLPEGSNLRLHACSVLVDEIKEAIDVFSLYAQRRSTRGRSGNRTRCLKISHIRLSFRGDVLSSTSVYRRVKPEKGIRRTEYAMRTPQSTGYQDLFLIQVTVGSHIVGTPSRFVTGVIFDAANVDFRRHSPGCMVVQDSNEANNTHSPQERDHFHQMVADTLVQRPIRAYWKGYYLTPTVVKGWTRVTTVMNDTFLATVELCKNGYRIRVYCYEEDVQMPNSTKTCIWETEEDGNKIKNAVIVYDEGAVDKESGSDDPLPTESYDSRATDSSSSDTT